MLADAGGARHQALSEFGDSLLNSRVRPLVPIELSPEFEDSILNVPIRLTQVRRLMGRALWAAAHTRLGRCPKPPSFHGVWGRWPQEAGGVRGATPLGEAESLS